jgi:hypothetical protein
MLLSGLSTVCGFLIAQTVMNCIVKECWTDTYDTHDTQSLLDHATLHEAKLQQQKKTASEESSKKKSKEESETGVELEQSQV